MYEEENLIFEIKPKLFSIGTITILNETISLLSIIMSKIRISEEFDLEQRTSNQGAIKVAPSTTKTTKFNVKLKISLEIRFIQKPIIIISKLILKWMEHQLKFKYKIFK
jgi:hypothetical protein